jgi:serine/threonine protein kinase
LLQLGYSEAMDVWSAGCIMAELFLALNDCGRMPLRGAIFPGEVDNAHSPSSDKTQQEEGMAQAFDQLDAIFDVLGTPSEEELAAMAITQTARARIRCYAPRLGRGLRARLPREAGETGYDLLDQMLRLLPGRRPTMAEALKHPFFAKVRSCSKEGAAPGRVDIGFDERELDKSVASIPKQLKQEIDFFQPRSIVITEEASPRFYLAMDERW